MNIESRRNEQERDQQTSRPEPGLHTASLDSFASADRRRAQACSSDKSGLGNVMHDNLPFSIDNRRLVAFNLAGVNNVPIQIMSLEDPAVAARFFDRFDPIGGVGKNIVITPSSDRTAAQMLLRDSGLIQGVQLGH